MHQYVHNAHMSVKSKRTDEMCFLHGMDFDDRPAAAIRLQQAREKRGFKSAREAARYFGWNYDTYIQHESGNRGLGRASERYATAYRVSEAWLLTGEGIGPDGHDASVIPLMGYVGAGAEIEPEFEQVPPDGLDQIHVPFPMPDDMIAFGVKGISMLPVYKDGAVIIAYREQKRPLEAFFGEDAVVRTSEGRRFIKTIMRGQTGVNLLSWNAAPIEDVKLEWIGEIFAVLPPLTLKKVARQGGIQGQLRFGT